MTLARSVSVQGVATSVALLALVAGCSGKLVGTDLTRQPEPTEPGEPSEPSEPLPPARPTDPPKCTTIAPACDPGDLSFASDKACNESAMAYCYSRTETCSKSVIWCGHRDPDECDGLPRCEPGDKQLGDASECFQNPPLSCYTRKHCGVTITCAKQ